MDKKDKENLIVEFLTHQASEGGALSKATSPAQIFQYVATLIASGELDNVLKDFCNAQKMVITQQIATLDDQKTQTEARLNESITKFDTFVSQLTITDSAKTVAESK